MSEAVKEFAKRVIQHAVFDAKNIDGDDVQDLAYELGLLDLVKYDPRVHGTLEDKDVEPGDDWYEFSELMK
jgi:hypothetical protein